MTFGFGFGFPRMQGVAAAFSPAVLFAAGEVGAWYDPSDLTTLFTDTAGTSPVTTPGQTVALMLDKSSTQTFEARRNLLTWTEDFSNAAWVSIGGTTRAVGSITSSASTALQGISRSATFTSVAGAYTESFDIKANGVRYVQLLWDVGVTSNFANFDLIDGVVSGGTYAGAAIASSGSGYFRITLTSTLSASAFAQVFLTFIDNGSATRAASYTGNGTNGVLIRNAQLETGSTATAYQAIGASLPTAWPGNHATQATTLSRPTYAIEPMTGRRNLLTFTEQFDNAVWSFSGSVRTLNFGIAPDGMQTSTRLQFSAADQDIRQTVAVGTVGTSSCWVKGTAGQTVAFINNLTDVVIKITLTGSWQFISRFGPTSNATLWFIGTWGGATARDIEIWHPQLETGSTATAYQRVTTRFDVTEAGVASKSYLFFDGSDDFMLTGTITPSTDKAQVFAGVRKLSDGAAVVAELSNNINNNNGALALLPTGYSALGARWGWVSAGTIIRSADTATNYAAPITNVLTGIGDISGDNSALRANGAQVAQNTGDQGTGNFLAYPLYIGRRGGTTLPFNGNIYGLITRFSAANLDAATITSTETWMNGKTGAYTANSVSPNIYDRFDDLVLDRSGNIIERRA